MIVTYKPKTIAEIMDGMSDQELIDVLPWIRNEDSAFRASRRAITANTQSQRNEGKK